MKTFRSSSSQATTEFGNKLAQSIMKKSTGKNSDIKHKHSAIILALHGDLGAGKTTFTQGFARGLGIKRRLISPTFVIMRRYKIPGTNKTKLKNLYHVDAYRIKTSDALETLGLQEIFKDPTAIALVEWPEKIKSILPKTTIHLKFQHGKKENERTLYH